MLKALPVTTSKSKQQKRFGEYSDGTWGILDKFGEDVKVKTDGRKQTNKYEEHL